MLDLRIRSDKIARYFSPRLAAGFLPVLFFFAAGIGDFLAAVFRVAGFFAELFETSFFPPDIMFWTCLEFAILRALAPTTPPTIAPTAAPTGPTSASAAAPAAAPPAMPKAELESEATGAPFAFAMLSLLKRMYPEPPHAELYHPRRCSVIR